MKFRTLAVLGLLTASMAHAQQPVPGEVWRYTLLEGSYFLDDCLICGRPAIQEPMRGTFDLVLLERNESLTRFGLSNVVFRSSLVQPRITTGSGLLEIKRGAASDEQFLILDVRVNDEPKLFTNDLNGITRRLPMIETHVVQEEYNLVQYFSMNIAAAPVRELWFITDEAFRSTNLNLTIAPGNLLSFAGKVAMPRSDLTGLFGFEPEPTALAGMTLAPGAQVLFALTIDVYSRSNGVAYERGDILSNHGELLISHDNLVANFLPQEPPVANGTDALFASSDGEIQFSVTTNFVSQRIGLISSGDMLGYRADSGRTNRLIRTGQQLLSAFNPLNPAVNPGLDALYVWPDGEAWFSTEETFESQRLGPISHGDLMSDRGYIVFRNADLVADFVPSTGSTNVGLAGVYVVSDAAAKTALPAFTNIKSTPGLRLDWSGAGRAFQVESAAKVEGPYKAISPVLPLTSYADPAATTNSAGFYRLQAW